MKLATLEHEIRFAKLHEKRAEVVAELYRCLVQAQTSLHSLSYVVGSDILSKSERENGETAKESVDAFWRYFDEHRIYLTESLCDKIKEFHRQSLRTYIELCCADISRELASDDETYRDELAQELENASKILVQEIPPIREAIEVEFRTLLGSESDNLEASTA